MQAMLSDPYRVTAHPGVLLTEQLTKLSIRPFAQLATGLTLWKILRKFLLRNYRQDPPRILTRPGTGTILPTPVKSPSAAALSRMLPIPITKATILPSRRPSQKLKTYPSL